MVTLRINPAITAMPLPARVTPLTGTLAAAKLQPDRTSRTMRTATFMQHTAESEKLQDQPRIRDAVVGLLHTLLKTVRKAPSNEETPRISDFETAFREVDDEQKLAYISDLIETIAQGTLETHADTVQLMQRSIEALPQSHQIEAIGKLCRAFARGHFSANVSQNPDIAPVSYAQPTQRYRDLHAWTIQKIGEYHFNHDQRNDALIALISIMKLLPDEARHAASLAIIERLQVLPAWHQRRVMAAFDIHFLMRYRDKTAGVALLKAIEQLPPHERHEIRAIFSSRLFSSNALAQSGFTE